MDQPLKPAPKWPDDLTRSDPLSLPKAVRTDPGTLIRLSTVKPVEINWFWYPYMPRGRVTSIEGDPGVGKSWFTCGLAAAVSQGMRLPGMREAIRPANVLMLSVEDGLADTVVPRLTSLDADLKRIYVPADTTVLDDRGMRRLEGQIEKTKAALVVIDPVQFFMGSKTDINSANGVRGWTAPLALIAERTDTAICIVRHMRKSNGDGKAIYAGLGSIDFAASVRSILQVAEGDENLRFVNHIKSNNAPKGKSMTFALTGNTIEWGALVDPSGAMGYGLPGGAGGATGGRGRADTKKQKALAFLRAVLAAGPVSVSEIENRGRDEGLTYSTLEKAKEALGARSFPRDRQWWWELLPEAGKPPAIAGEGPGV